MFPNCSIVHAPRRWFALQYYWVGFNFILGCNSFLFSKAWNHFWDYRYKTVNIKSCSASAIMLTISPNFKYSMFVQERISCKICHIKKKVDVNLPVIPCSHPIMFCKQNILRPTQAIRGLANWKYVSMIFQQMPFISPNNAHEHAHCLLAFSWRKNGIPKISSFDESMHISFACVMTQWNITLTEGDKINNRMQNLSNACFCMLSFDNSSI